MAVSAIPKGHPAVSPYLLLNNASRAIDILTGALGGLLVEKVTAPDGKIRHAEVRIGDSAIMIGEVQAGRDLMPGSVHVYLADVDAAYAAALKLGATSIAEPTTQFYGDRSAGVKDACGNIWWIATHVEDISEEEMLRRMSQQKPK